MILKKENKTEEIMLLNFKNYCKFTFIKTLYIVKRQTDKWKRLENPELDTHIYSHMILPMVQRKISRVRQYSE